MIWNHPTHRDGRHGHGSDEFPGRVGVKKHFYDTIQLGDLDPRLQENEIVLGINEDFGPLAVPRVEIWKEDFVFNTTVSEVPFVVLCLPATHTMGAYHRSVDGEVISLSRSGDSFIDDSSSSLWNIEGRCVEGPWAGKSLKPLNFATLEWHAWVSYHPETEIYESPAKQTLMEVQDPCLAEVCRLIGENHTIERQWPVMKAWLPERADSGVEIVIKGHPLHLFHFKGASEGEDWAFCRTHSVGRGCLAATSFPDTLYSDPAHQERLPEDQIQWSPLIENGEITESLEQARGRCSVDHPTFPKLGEFVEHLEAAGHRIRQRRYLLSSEITAQAEVGFSLMIGRDRWMLLRFPSRELAAQESERRGHCIQAGKFLLWSDPPGMYVQRLTFTRPDEEISWSEALEDEAFRTLIEKICSSASEGITPSRRGQPVADPNS